MLDCPNCTQPSISAFQKQFLSPLRKIECANCGAQVSVGWLQSVIPGIIGAILPIVWFFVLVVSDSLAATAVAIFTLVLLGVHHHFIVPLKVRSLPNND